MDKLIITLAPTGNVPSKALNINTPISNEEIVKDLKACQALGVSIAHLHVRDHNQLPTSDRACYKSLLDLIEKEGINIITQVSTGARGGLNTSDYRGQMLDLKCDMASLSTGSSNFPNSINGNSPELIRDLAEKMKANDIKPEIEVFDAAMINNAKHLLKKGVLKGPLHFNLVMNVPGSLPGTPKNLMFLIDSLPDDATFSVSGIGKSQVSMLSMAIMLGGHVRTGLEDVIRIGDKIASNESLVEQVVKIANLHKREIATPEEAKILLNL